MKCSPVAKKMEAVNKSLPLRTLERKIRAKNYSSFIYRLLKRGDQDISLSQDLMSTIASEAARLCLYNKRRTITRREIEGAMKKILSENTAAASGVSGVSS